MKSFGDYLDEFEVAKALKNDSKLAEYLGVTRSYVGQMRHSGKATDEFCIEIAETVGAEPALVIMQRDMLRNPVLAKVWGGFLSKISIFSVAAALAALPPNIDAAEAISAEKLPVILRQTSNKDYRKLFLSFLFMVLRHLRKTISSNQQKTACPVLATSASIVS